MVRQQCRTGWLCRILLTLVFFFFVISTFRMLLDMKLLERLSSRSNADTSIKLNVYTVDNSQKLAQEDNTFSNKSNVLIQGRSSDKIVHQEKDSTILSGNNDSRIQRIRHFCSTLHRFPKEVSKRMRELTLHWTLADDERKALYCTISKASSSTLKYYLMKLKDPNVPTAHFQIHSPQLLRTYGFRFLREYTQEEADFRLKNYYKYMVSRDPFDRLVSTHRDKFLQKDEVCYRNHEGGKIKRKYRPKDVSMKKDVEFWEFLKYVANGDDPINYDRHWIPQFYVCDPCNVHYDYVAKVETFDRDIHIIFNHLNISWNGLPRQNSHGQTHNKSLGSHFSTIDSSDLHRLSKIYKFDMEAFGYSAPWL